MLRVPACADSEAEAVRRFENSVSDIDVDILSVQLLWAREKEHGHQIQNEG